MIGYREVNYVKFQSTLPVGGATLFFLMSLRGSINFNPRSPWGERPILSAAMLGESLFQSTLPVGGATGSSHYHVRNAIIFQSTLPVGGATMFLAMPG